MTKPWVVVQNAGYTNEKIVHEAWTFHEAVRWMNDTYETDEQEELHVDIMQRCEDGTLTTEF